MPNLLRIRAFAFPLRFTFIRAFQIYPFCSMSSSTSKSAKAHQRENEIYQSVASRLRKEVQDSGTSARTTHEHRTAADPRQNTIHDVRLTSILDLYESVRLLRLQVMYPSTIDPEQELGHLSYINASNTSIVIQQPYILLSELTSHINSLVLTRPVVRCSHSRPASSC